MFWVTFVTEVEGGIRKAHPGSFKCPRKVLFPKVAMERGALIILLPTVSA